MDNENSKYVYKGLGLNRTECKHGQQKFDEYCTVYHITAYSDLQLLEELIYREIMQENFKVQIEEKKKKTETENKTLSEKDQKDVVIATYMVDAMNQNLEQIFSLKEKLGLINNQEGDDGFKYLQQLEEKFRLWEKENQASREVVCPHCSKLILLHIRTETWEAQKHPLFKDKILYNEHLVKMFLENKITSEDVAKVLGTSPSYVQWLIEKWHQRKEKENE